MKRKNRKPTNGSVRRGPRPKVHHVLFGVAPRKPSNIEEKAKAAVLKILDQAEKHPDRVIDGIGKLIEAARETYRFVEENPNKAKELGAYGALSLLAGFAKKQLEGK